jgi:hypothetical protein
MSRVAITEDGKRRAEVAEARTGRSGTVLVHDLDVVREMRRLLFER